MYFLLKGIHIKTYSGLKIIGMNKIITEDLIQTPQIHNNILCGCNHHILYISCSKSMRKLVSLSFQNKDLNISIKRIAQQWLEQHNASQRMSLIFEKITNIHRYDHCTGIKVGKTSNTQRVDDICNG